MENGQKTEPLKIESWFADWLKKYEDKGLELEVHFRRSHFGMRMSISATDLHNPAAVYRKDHDLDSMLVDLMTASVDIWDRELEITLYGVLDIKQGK